MNKAKTWEVHYFDHRVQLEKKSRVFRSRESALLHACDLERDRLLVRYVQGPGEERIMPPEIVDWGKKHRTPLKPADE